MKYCCLTLVLLFIALAPLCAQQNSADTLTISTSYNNLLSNPEHAGMLDQIASEAVRRIGMKAEIVYSETASSLVDVNNGLADIELNRIEGMEQSFPNLVRVEEPNMIMDFVAFSRKSIPINGFDSIKNLYIGIVKGWKIYETNTAGFPNLTMVRTEAELFRMLDKDRLDIVLYSKLTGYSHIREQNYKNIQHLEPPLAQRPMYMYLHKSKAELAAPLAEALKSMKEDGTYQKITEATFSKLYE